MDGKDQKGVPFSPVYKAYCLLWISTFLGLLARCEYDKIWHVYVNYIGVIPAPLHTLKLQIGML